MRAAFLFVILALAAIYTFIAFTDLSWLTRAGRLGPGYFPRLIGIGVIVLCVASLIADWRRMREDEPISPYWHVAVVVVALTAVFVGLLNVLGGLLAMIAFMLSALWFLNRDRPVMNLAISVALPVSVYLLFAVWLNASVPRGLIALPL